MSNKLVAADDHHLTGLFDREKHDITPIIFRVFRIFPG
jgi:hypothetical protein